MKIKSYKPMTRESHNMDLRFSMKLRAQNGIRHKSRSCVTSLSGIGKDMKWV